jgi:hypothetical protein
MSGSSAAMAAACPVESRRAFTFQLKTRNCCIASQDSNVLRRPTRTHDTPRRDQSGRGVTPRPLSSVTSGAL